MGRDVEQTPATVLSRDALAFLSRASDLELSAYREEHVAERVRRTLAREGLTAVDELARLLARDSEARSRFRRSVAVSATGLFRDRPQFVLLERELLPPLLVDGKRRLRVWSAGCADGTEVYSVAMVLDKLGVLDRAFLLGSDLLEENLAAARRGIYGPQTISSRLRGCVRWERRDLLRDGAASGHWQLILCRNVAIYLGDDAKRFLHRLLADSLTVGGVLLLGRSERIADATSMRLERVGPHAYRRRT